MEAGGLTPVEHPEILALLPRTQGRGAMDTRLAVLEGKWWPDSNVSVRYLFDCIAHLRHSTPDAYHYEMFCDGAALDNVVRRVACLPSVQLVYIAAHGGSDGIAGSDGEIIKRRKLQDIFGGFARGSIEGIYFGTCFFADEDNARFLLCEEGRYSRMPAKWVAGYDQKVDWLKSSVLDMFFWVEYLEACDDGETPVNAVRRAADRITRCMRGLARELGFQAYIRKPGAGAHDVAPLIDYPRRDR
jgi:hypothetical protein